MACSRVTVTLRNIHLRAISSVHCKKCISINIQGLPEYADLQQVHSYFSLLCFVQPQFVNMLEFVRYNFKVLHHLASYSLLTVLCEGSRLLG